MQLDDSRSGWEKPSMTLKLDGQSTLSQITVWESGEVEIQHADIATGRIGFEHREVAVVADLLPILDALRRWQREGGVS
ncbi:hypothetical protein ACH4Y0_33755 [Streptomyces sp. NPDC020707]|uniref:immunity protein TriTu family protein n=1 Tax=Streptomyces sp. NPDC020707 TaxID=3365084 RepID=UPI0037BA9C93